MSTANNLNFWTAKNYMKRDVSTGSASLAAPVTSIYGGIQFVTRLTITHSLGIVPFFDIFYEPFNDGVIWEPMGTRTQGNVVNPRNTAVTGPYLNAYADTSGLNLEIGYTSNLLTGPFTVYYIIYRDYGIA